MADQATPPAPRNNRRLLGWTWRETRGFLFVVPWLIGFIGFIAGPFLFSLFIAMTNWRMQSDPKWVGLHNFVGLLNGEDTRFVQAVYNTTYYVVFHVPGILIISFAIAALLNRKVKGVAIYRTAFYLPSITTGVATAVLWYWMLQPNGLLNNLLDIFLNPFGIDAPNWLGSTKWAMPGLILMSFGVSELP